MTELIELLKEELKRAEKKEELAEREMIDSGVKTKLYPKPKFVFAYQKAQGYVNGVMSCIEIARGIKEDD